MVAREPSAVTVRRAVADLVTPGRTITTRGFDVVFDAPAEIIPTSRDAEAGVDATVRVFRRGREIEVDPHRICINPPTYVPDGTFTTVERELHGRRVSVQVPGYREDPAAAYLSWLLDSIEQVPAAKGFRTRGTVTTFFAPTDNGFIDSSSATYATARDGGGSFYVSSTDDPTMGYTTSAGLYFLDMAFVRFDTSSITDTDTIDAAALAVFGVTSSFLSGSETFEARTGYTWSGSGVTSADWRTGAQFAALTLVATFASGSWSDSGYNTFTESGTDFRSAVNKTGYTEITLCTSKHRNPGTAPTDLSYATFRNATASGTTNDPKLTVTHTAAAGGFTPRLALLGVG